VAGAVWAADESRHERRAELVVGLAQFADRRVETPAAHSAGYGMQPAEGRRAGYAVASLLRLTDRPGLDTRCMPGGPRAGVAGDGDEQPGDVERVGQVCGTSGVRGHGARLPASSRGRTLKVHGVAAPRPRVVAARTSAVRIRPAGAR
jgi:hypothetical protein